MAATTAPHDHRRLAKMTARITLGRSTGADRREVLRLGVATSRRMSAAADRAADEMAASFGQRIAGLTVGGRELHAGVFNENEVRAAAGLTLVLGAAAFSLALFEQQYVPLQVVSTFFFVEFLVRTTRGIRLSPIGVAARWMTRSQPPEWVSAKPKLFAWRLGLVMALSMTIITNSGIRGALPATLCAGCMTLMWMEASLGLCLGCKIHALLLRRGWKAEDPEVEICAHGVCALPRG